MINPTNTTVPPREPSLLLRPTRGFNGEIIINVNLGYIVKSFKKIGFLYNHFPGCYPPCILYSFTEIISEANVEKHVV